MSLPNTLQLIFHDHTGVHTIVNDQGDFVALNTIAIALQNTRSALFIRIVEIEIDTSESAGKGIRYISRYQWLKSTQF